MTKQTTAERKVNMNMGFCLNCHTQKKVSIDCETCHYWTLMERRDFIKISALSGVWQRSKPVGSPEKQLIRFVPEEELIPGIATWKPSVCTLCSAGCGLLVRVMQGEAEVVRHGQQGLMKMGLAKKLEGNPSIPSIGESSARAARLACRCSTIPTASPIPSSAPARAAPANFRK